MSRSLAQRVGRNYSALKADTDERIKCLRLQAIAWRQLTMIAMVDPEYVRKQAQWLLFNSVPFVDGVALEKMVAEHEKLAEECSVKGGVCSRTPGPEASASSTSGKER